MANVYITASGSAIVSKSFVSWFGETSWVVSTGDLVFKISASGTGGLELVFEAVGGAHDGEQSNINLPSLESDTLYNGVLSQSYFYNWFTVTIGGTIAVGSGGSETFFSGAITAGTTMNVKYKLQSGFILL